ncbi:MAG: hydrogenase expression/formation protein HypE [Candidatus Omnitrophica bacterium]|nr:MAG: Hydrogenase expression/formation protein HypE [Candidatus Hinthialibacteria bacterium OLB16]MBV6481061.1 Carbamoyl dehydratase HypE [bacterium]MCC6732958.1 hydrogenase expression/formation protein HypE [Candidatus Omnitrophota bacterium]MCE7909047.1 hydrogenase expression/formation protein HypE [Candidatus Omnitrophica bacterium COP1]MCK6496815.1 hydrogenase expression/formation protein HypE [bacterium]
MTDFNQSCPIPIADYPHILLAHGGGGRLMNQLIERMFRKAFDNPELNHCHDGACLDLPAQRIALTTDSYVVHPLFFPGGDIGSMAVYGTVNDLAMCGALPLYLTAGFIIEEGLPMETLWRVVQSMSHAAREAGVSVVTGDTKVVNHGKGDGLFINTAGVGVLKPGIEIGPRQIREGDAILLNGDIGSHGIAIMARREGLEFETALESDLANLSGLVQELMESHLPIHCMRDLTRGGLASALNEIASTADLTIEIHENQIPVKAAVRGACGLLGLDPLYVANEGRFIIILPEEDAEPCLSILQAHPLGAQAVRIGSVRKKGTAPVELVTPFGLHRILDLLSGEQLPRIC